MSLTPFLIATLTRLDASVVRRAISTAAAQDDPGAPVPTEFTRGQQAMAYALALFIRRRPLHFYVGLAGLVAFPIYLAVRLVMGLMTMWGGTHGG
ncbi:hypothetical protein WL96_15340 (plasmid) [Burkholderia vietnamiensis]|nr:hypothetical protein WL96_15340 [Burkholderia vietnamiensis]